ncbi:hypothetical protein GGI25_006198 [Coemansia spiralis]|uniref:GSKIP domain-containing protein n=2 Tax=Coemansia TaxID=4863 RepID=A0A9W8G2K4_9FUNG|nr:hypothetical protein EDC05_006459 [Coemansia umbellata]KAJ2618847.1 hypothetical protein GGI26_006311 [Coemansia sp. RSA 1358]KAJ2669323.1 hypothetical protein GGI25_006198 [Coemansia spiralis]
MDALLFTSPEGLLGELQAELDDNAYGIQSFTFPALADLDGCLQARSTVVLLEDTQVVIALDGSGYTAVHADGDTSLDKSFETLPALLAALSPGFGAAMHNRLYEKLLVLAEPNGNNGQGGDDDDDFDG